MYLGNYIDVQIAMEETMKDLIKSRDNFDAATSRLLGSKEYQQMGKAIQGDIQILVQSCKNCMLGNLKWS